jgi:hypothetical protein
MTSLRHNHCGTLNGNGTESDPICLDGVKRTKPNGGEPTAFMCGIPWSIMLLFMSAKEVCKLIATCKFFQEMLHCERSALCILGGLGANPRFRECQHPGRRDQPKYHGFLLLLKGIGEDMHKVLFTGDAKPIFFFSDLCRLLRKGYHPFTDWGNFEPSLYKNSDGLVCILEHGYYLYQPSSLLWKCKCGEVYPWSTETCEICTFDSDDVACECGYEDDTDDDDPDDDDPDQLPYCICAALQSVGTIRPDQSSEYEQDIKEAKKEE